MATETELKDWLKTVIDPELSLGVVDLGLVYHVKVEGAGQATVEMTLTSPACPMGDQIVSEIKKRLLEHSDVQEVEVKIVWDPKWDPEKMASEECKEVLGIW